MKKAQTDNSYLNDKIDLRIACLPNKKNINVLDLFHGDGLIWNKIKLLKKDIKFNVIGFDKKNNGSYRGDNVKFLKSMNLENYDIIDCDAYGVPYKQLDEIFKKNIKGKVVFVTFIQSLLGTLPYDMLCDIGYLKDMIRKCPTLFSANGVDKLKLWLAKKGVDNIKIISHNRKHYLSFKI